MEHYCETTITVQHSWINTTIELKQFSTNTKEHLNIHPRPAKNLKDIFNSYD